MDPVTAKPAHLLMQLKERQDNHGPKAASAGAASAFATYAFGPMALPDGKAARKIEDKPEGAPVAGNPLKAPTMGWITQVQGAEGIKPTDKSA